MEEAAALHFTTESIMLSVDEQPTRSGMTGAQFVRRLSQHISDPANTGGFPEAPLAYDAIWALALAFNCTASRLPVGVRLEEFTYADKHFTDTLFQCMLNTSFKGVSGDVSFSNLGDRLARTQIEQLQGGRYRVVGYYDTTMKHLDWKGTEMWGSRGGSPPPDATIVRDSLLVVSPLLYYTVALFSILGVAACVFALRMNRRNAHRSIIVHSQPECNNLLIIGCALSCADLFLMGMPTKQLALPPYLFSLLCHCRLSILMVGFSFAYGSMFAKMWIAYRIASIQQRARLESQRDEPIPATRFYSVVALLVLVDLILILTWGVVDPLQRRRQFFPLQEPPPTDGDEAVDEMLRPVLELCESDNQEVWIALVMGYKCLLLIFGLFLAYESRRVKLLYINDVRLVGLAVYNVAVLAIITGPVVTFLIRSQANSNFGFIAATVLLCSVVSLGLVFLPKWWHLRRHATDEAAVAEAVIPKLSLVEQKRLEQLRRENERLVNEIAQRDAQMRWVRSRMEAVQRAENARVFANISTEPSPSQQRGAMALQQMEIPRHRVKDGSSDYCTDTDEEEDENSTGLVELQPSDGTGHFSSGAVVNPEEEDVESDEILL